MQPRSAHAEVLNWASTSNSRPCHKTNGIAESSTRRSPQSDFVLSLTHLPDWP